MTRTSTAHASREAKKAHLQAPCQLPKCRLPRQLTKHWVDLHSQDYHLRVTGTIPTPLDETAPAKKRKTAPERVAAPTPKAVTKKPEACGNPAKSQSAICKKPSLPQGLVPEIFTKTKKVLDICKASILGSYQGEPVLSSHLHQRGETYPPLNYKNHSA